jgi:hypothetical protein
LHFAKYGIKIASAKHTQMKLYMKRTLLALLSLVALGACKKSQNEIVREKVDVVQKDIAIAITGANLETDLTQQGNSTYNLLGYGYDVTDKYADAESVRAEVIDVPSFVANNPSRFDLGRSSQAYSKRIDAENAEDLAKQFTQKFEILKDFKLFRNSIINTFPNENALNNQYLYGYYSNVVEQKRLKINYDLTQSNNLTTTFTQDLATLSAEKLVEKYGTHVLSDIKLGAKFNVFYQAQTSKSVRKEVGATGLNFALNKVFSLFAGNLDPLDYNLLNANNSAKVYYDAVGGDLSKLKISPTKIDIKDWHLSATEDKSKFIDIAENGLIPLYELIKDAGKKAEVKDYIIKYITENQVVNKR